MPVMPTHPIDPPQPFFGGPAAGEMSLRRPTTWLVASERRWAPLVLRLTLALVFFPHGAQKAFGWFGGHGWNGTMAFFTQQQHLPSWLAALIILVETLGPVLLVLGWASRLVAIGLIGVMIGAIVLVHLPFGFFMNWTGTQAGEGYEFHLLAIGAAVALLIAGSGAWSIDRVIAKRLGHRA